MNPLIDVNHNSQSASCNKMSLPLPSPPPPPPQLHQQKTESTSIKTTLDATATTTNTITTSNLCTSPSSVITSVWNTIIKAKSQTPDRVSNSNLISLLTEEQSTSCNTTMTMAPPTTMHSMLVTHDCKPGNLQILDNNTETLSHRKEPKCIMYRGYKKLCNAKSLFLCNKQHQEHDSNTTVNNRSFNTNDTTQSNVSSGILNGLLQSKVLNRNCAAQTETKIAAKELKQEENEQVGHQKKACFYSQLLKKRIQKICQESANQAPEMSLINSTKMANPLVTNQIKESVINNKQELNKSILFNHQSTPFKFISKCSSEGMINKSNGHQSMNSYLDSLIRTNVILEEELSQQQLKSRFSLNQQQITASNAYGTSSQAQPSKPIPKVSAITKLLNSDYSPPSSPTTCHNNRSKSDNLPTQSKINSCLGDISDKVYQQLIEFEFNHESILRKFQTDIKSANESSTSPIGMMNKSSLNAIEKHRIDELENVLSPLQFCLSSTCERRAILKRDIHKSFFNRKPTVSVDFQRQTLLATTEQSINLLIELTKKLESFSELNSADQMTLLRTSVMEIMLMRSILILPRRLKERINKLKRCLSDNESNTICDTNVMNNETILNETSLPKLDVKSEHMEPCTNHRHDFDQIDSHLHCRFEEMINMSPESSRDSDHDDNQTSIENKLAADYAKLFRTHYIRLARSIDKDWYEDKTIFYLLFAILLFRPTKSQIEDCDKVREQHLTYVYLLKRYLENKFRSYCTARSHFIRIFDRLEELQRMNDQVIQKLLDFDLLWSIADTITMTKTTIRYGHNGSH
ncbi:Nuclear receptor [Blomia tropicalis]|nr:Nuclear receptor [Blomia tropicalis]